MSKKYIKNCTGVDCSERKSSSGASHASVLLSRIIFLVLLVSFIGVSLYIIFFSTYLQILSVEISGTRELNSAEVKQRIDSLLQEKYAGIVPKNNFLFISQGKVEGVLKGDFKKIRTVTVSKKFPDSVNINIDERKALLVWCSGERCYLVDEKGLAYGEADFNSPELIQNHLLRINDGSSREIMIGEEIMEPTYEKYVLEIGEALASAGFSVSGDYYTPSRMAEEVRVKMQNGPEIYFSTQFSLKSAMLGLTTVWEKEIPKDKRDMVEYIDLRNENKVFYKFKNDEPAGDEDSQDENIENK